MKLGLKPKFKQIALYLRVPFTTKGPSGKCEERKLAALWNVSYETNS